LLRTLLKNECEHQQKKTDQAENETTDALKE